MELKEQISTDHLRLRIATRDTRALCHKLRLRILLYILEHPGTTVQPIYVHLRIEQSICSGHLRILRRCGYVEGVRCPDNRKMIQYTAVLDKLTHNMDLIDQWKL